METHSTGRLACKTLKRYFELNKIPSKYLIGIATDCALSMIGKYCDYSRILKS